ncbi:YceK/YidQ family lipoprotein [Methylomicrobium lacus]|uniref:YceK/YidQ family lipoprotein n=1 Tax=Methylomicrobium lacus TaxID=136992 RepID=UPI00045E6338|nr:YceK/YidQ family lipoprotein [Methylomicrobium lacus]
MVGLDAYVLLSILTVGCSSIRARTDILDDKGWTIYPGVQQDVQEMGKLARGEPLKSSGDERSKQGWIKGMIATLLVLDLPFSTVFDTVVAPYDLYRIYNPQEFEDVCVSPCPKSDQTEEE